MNKSSSSASSSPPFTTLPPPPTIASTTVPNQRTTPSVIPVEYNYRIMSPSSLSQIRQHTASNTTRPQTTSTQLDNSFDNATQYNSLFGDPVPPPRPSSDFFGSQLDSRAVHLFHATPIEINGSSEEETNFGRPVTMADPGRLFSSVPYTSLLNRHSSDISVERNFDNLPTALPRLKPPDIQILPNSSGGSSAEDPHDSPNNSQLAPGDILRRQTLYDIGEPADVSEYSETLTINDARGVRKYSEATRRMSNFNTDFKANVGSFNTSPVEDTSPTALTLDRQFSNESYSSSEWFRPSLNDFPEFSKMPKLRPSSKNVMSIKRDEMPTQHSPVAAMINDSNESSSGAEERLLDSTQTLTEPTVSLDILAPLRPPEPSSALLHGMDASSQGETFLQHRNSVFDTSTVFPPSPATAPQTQFSEVLQPYIETEIELESPKSIKREMSPFVMRESIATGSDYRVDNLRLHKKTSFTIISDRSPQSSRAQTPTSHAHNYLKPQQNSFSQTPTTITTPTLTLTPTPTSITTSKPTVRPRHHLQRKSLTSTELRIPHLLPQVQPSDDSPRPSVQFDMSGRYSPSKMPQKGILQYRESLSSYQETPLPTQLMPIPPPVPRRRPSVLPRMSPLASTLPFHDQQKMRSCEALPLITDPYRTAIPRLHRSSFDVREHAIFPPGALPRPLKPNPNPTRNQRGLLRVINSADSLSRIPLRSNWTASADDLTGSQRRRSSLSTLDLQMRRRSSSTSPERRSSTQTASDRRSSNLSSITTSDFSFRRPSFTNTQPLTQRRKSIFPGSKSTPTTPRRRQSVAGIKSLKRTPRTKISKPTTLSPIIGTPNKGSNSPQSPSRGTELTTLLNASETLSDSTSRRESLSKIPIRSDINSRSSSHPGSQVQSRSGSPIKELTMQSPISGRTSRAASSRSPSRATARSDLRPVSRTDSRTMISRSSSRASTRQISRGPPSLGSSRPNSRMDEARITGSHRNSRMDHAREIANSRSNSRASTRSPLGRAISVSPSTLRKRSALPLGRRKSVSLSPKAMRRSVAKRRSASPAAKKRGVISGKSLERRKSQSRIPTRAKSDLSATGPKRSSSKSRINHDDPRRTASERKKTPSQSRKEPTSAKKVPTSVKKPESSVKRTASSVNKPSITATKKQPSNLQKPSKNLKTGPLLNAQKKATGGALNMTSNGKTISKSGEGKQETSVLKKKNRPEAKELKKQNSLKKLGKSSDAMAATGLKPATADSVTTATSSGSAGANQSETAIDESSTIAATATATGALMSGMKRQPSAMSLIRMGSRLSLLSKKRPDSSLSRHITEEVEEPTDGSAQQNDESGTTKLHRVTSSGQLMTADGMPAVILDKSTKTLDNIPKTATVATDEIHRKINENVADLKSLEHDLGRVSDGAVSPTASITTVVENRATKTGESATSNERSAQPPGQPIEASVSVVNTSSGTANSDRAIAAERVSASTAISVLPEVDCESANFQNFELGIKDKPAGVDGGTNAADDVDASALTDEPSSSSGLDGIGKHRQSPDGQGGSPSGSGGGRTGSRELLEAPDDDTTKGCCRCCARFCMPCRRARCSRCCHRKKKLDHDADEAEDRPVLSATSSTTTTNLEVIDETTGKKKKGCWQKLNCFKKKNIKSESGIVNEEISKAIEPMHEATPPLNMGPTTTPKQGKCGACLRKIFCCRSTNKVETTTSDDEEHANKKCACFPCCRKKSTGSELGSRAWQDAEQGITTTDASEDVTAAAEDGCCKRFWRKIFCCCRKKQAIVPSNSRRASMRAPPPPAEDTRRKLHNDLVEYTSKMKGAIPVLPLYLAWFCAICNTLFPGLGTLFSGIFCICVGIPRFSQYDSAKARLGSFIINTIVAASQLFCVLFCFVGWGWSIWWGTIMLKCAKKLSKIRKVERLEMEEEKRQAAAAAAAAKAEVIHAAGKTETTKT